MTNSLIIIFAILFLVTYVTAICTYEEYKSIVKTVKITSLVLVSSIILLTVFCALFMTTHTIIF